MNPAASPTNDRDKFELVGVPVPMDHDGSLIIDRETTRDGGVGGVIEDRIRIGGIVWEMQLSDRGRSKFVTPRHHGKIGFGAKLCTQSIRAKN